MRYVVAVDVELNQEDYSDAKRIRDKLRCYIQETKSSIDRNKQEKEEWLFVFPELVGAWLALCGQYQATCNEITMLYIILRNPYCFIRLLCKNIFKRRYSSLIGLLQRVVFQIQATQTLRLYQNIFSDIAKEFSSYIVAGSAYLPLLEISGNYVNIQNEATLYNVALSFSPDGNIIDASYKTHAVLEELEFLDEAPLDDIHSFDCGTFGRVGVLICADSWYPESYEKLHGQEGTLPDILAVPSFSSGNWNEEWSGYSGKTPKDVEHLDLARSSITLGDAWRRYAVPGRVPPTSRQCTIINSFFRGKILGMQAQGKNIIYQSENVSRIEFPHILCLESFPTKLTK